jgi:uncharacterized protein with ATP-grasp and redox domains
MESNTLDQAARASLQQLARENSDGVVTSPFPDGRVGQNGLHEEERRTWEQRIRENEGRTWFDIPWYFAESFFYFKLLAAFGYYCGDRRDPFHPQKEQELMDPHGGLAMARHVLDSARGMGTEEALAFHLHCALWGNRLDLSTFEVDESRRKDVLTRDRDLLLVDHTRESCAALVGAKRIGVLLDNAGPELVCDLLLADRMLSESMSTSIVLHAKKAPFFVSDGTISDTLHTVDVLADAHHPRVSAAGERLRRALRVGRLRVQDHWFWNSALHFTAFPPDLKNELAGFDLLILKGDANYRRTLEDRMWDPSLSMDELAAYFPAPFISLRTMKSEIVVDLPDGEAERLSRVDRDWMINGKRGLVRFCRVRQ